MKRVGNIDLWGVSGKGGVWKKCLKEEIERKGNVTRTKGRDGQPREAKRQ